MSENKTSVERLSRTQKLIAATASAGLLATGAACAQPPARAESTPAVCIPSTETKPFTFTAADGKDSAIHAIQGSGRGEGDPCWDEAEALVQAGIGEGQPQYDSTIEIPVSISQKNP